MRNFFRLAFFKGKRATAVKTEATNFNWQAGSGVQIQEWADWLINRPSPTFNPNTRRYMLSRYWFGSQGHEKLRLEMFDRWGYCMDISGNSSGMSAESMQSAIADARTANPSTANGRLTKIALSDPAKYKIGFWAGQSYPTTQEAPDGFLRDASGNITNSWSPLATPAAMATAVAKSTDGLAVLKAEGLQVAIAYHGGETGLSPLLSDPPQKFVDDAAVLAAKGSTPWWGFISDRKGDQVKLFRDRIAQLAPERQVYVFYPCDARPYPYIPGDTLYNWDYQYMRQGTDLPSSSNYYLEFNPDLGNPDLRFTPGLPYNTYYDLATNTMSAAIEQKITYNQPLSYDWVCPLGWYRSESISDPGIDPARLSNPLRAQGYMKMACMAGSVGFVDGYFGVDCVPEFSAYTPLDPLDPPPWLINPTFIAEAHARFSWLDKYTFDGDLLTPPDFSRAKNLPAHEFGAYRKIGVFYSRVKEVRCWIRKHLTSDSYLILVWVIDGLDRPVWIRDIPGVKPFEVNARTKGSLYTIDVFPGSQNLVWQDPPVPNPLDVPVLFNVSASPTKIRIRYYAPRSLDPSRLPDMASFAVTGGSISNIAINHVTRLHDELVINLTNPLPAGNATISYSGNSFRDTENNLVTPFSVVKTIFAQILSQLASGIVFSENEYTVISGASFTTSTMASSVKMDGDGEMYCELVGGAMIALSTEATNAGSYESWAYTINSGVVSGNPVLAAFESGTGVNIGAGGSPFAPLVPDSFYRLSRSSGVVKISTRPKSGGAWQDVFTFSATNTQPLYIHGAFGVNNSTISGLTIAGFA